MEIILTSIFSVIIIFTTFLFLIKAYIIAYKRKEISRNKFIFLSTISLLISVIVASVLPFAFHALYSYLY